MSTPDDTHMGPGFPAGSRNGRKEQRLCTKILRHENSIREAALELVALYADQDLLPHAQSLALRIVEASTDPQRRAMDCLTLGADMEILEQFTMAAWAYHRGLTHQSTAPEVRYWLHNNLGYSLNQLEGYHVAEPHCRRAIAIDAARCNAHKNLAVALHGQGKYVEAAQSYARAAKAEPFDRRALRHLAFLAEKHVGVIASSAPEAMELLEDSAEMLAELGPLSPFPAKPTSSTAAQRGRS